MTLAEYQYEEYKADIDLIGMMTKPEEEEHKEQASNELEEEVVIPDNLRHLLAKWEAAVCEIRAENKVCENNMYISQLCDKLENSMVAYSKGNVEFAHFRI